MSDPILTWKLAYESTSDLPIANESKLWIGSFRGRGLVHIWWRKDRGGGPQFHFIQVGGNHTGEGLTETLEEAKEAAEALVPGLLRLAAVEVSDG